MVSPIDRPRGIRNSLLTQKVKFKLPGRIWKLCLEETFSNLRSNWARTKNDIKKVINKNSNLRGEDKHYLRYILKSNVLLHSVLTRTEFNLPDKLKDYSLNKKYLDTLLCRYTRRYKFNKPRSRKRNYYQVNSFRQKGNELKIQGLVSGKRIKLLLSDSRSFPSQKTIRIINPNLIEIISYVKIKEISNISSIPIGIDKGLKTVLSTSTGNKYGENYSALSNDWQDILNKKNKKRNKLRSLAKSLKTLKPTTSNSIQKFNLGTIKRDKVKNVQTTQLKSFINNAINKFIRTEKPKEIVIEDLSWSKFKNKGKRTNRNLASWLKGYLNGRLIYKCNIFNIRVVEVNPAYTSQMCSHCGKIGIRKGESFQCEEHGGLDADLNAAKNILNRSNDTEITKYTSVQRVKEILLDRFKTVVGLSGTTKTSEAGSYSIDLSLEERNVLGCT
jgi:putative transposase